MDLFNDSRITQRSAQLNDHTYLYILGVPTSGFRATVFLVHGWPDLAVGWRNQIPALLDLGLRVVAPDMMGYGGTDAPHVPPESIALYGQKRSADDLAELARQLEAPKIILGGHDWGGVVVFRLALYYPDLVTHIFSICTPYIPPTDTFYPLEDIVRTRLPNFTYQLQLAGPDVEGTIKDRQQIKRFLNGIYGGRGEQGEALFDVKKGVLFENLDKVGKSPLLSEKEVDYYTEQFARNGLHGPLNWYRTREQNHEDELPLVDKANITQPVLFVQALKDRALPPQMAHNMPTYLSKLTMKEVNTDHWALWEKPEAVNAILKEWIEGVVLGGKSVL
ncbi:MAG: hypothetical protein M1817_001234 [Caeruleum heppii]|nr:MAG: hypothetical protein M1817_001234 [Caeruleum heppii]